MLQVVELSKDDQVKLYLKSCTKLQFLTLRKQWEN